MVNPPRPHWLEPFHVPDRIFLVLALLLMIATLWVEVWAWPHLPARMPQHLNAAGVVDGYGTKNLWTVFGVSILNIVVGLSMAFVYAHPQYTNLPTTKEWRHFTGKIRDQLVIAIRHFLTMVFVWATLLMSGVSLALIAAGLGVYDPSLTTLLFAVTGMMLLTVGGYSVVLTRWINQVTE